MKVQDVSSSELAQLKERNEISPDLQGCHTAFVEGYIVEGHVPADVIHRLLEERPRVAGLTVPGMPVGSPGMEGSYGEPYEILTFDADGRTTVYERR